MAFNAPSEADILLDQAITEDWKPLSSSGYSLTASIHSLSLPDVSLLRIIKILCVIYFRKFRDLANLRN